MSRGADAARVSSAAAGVAQLAATARESGAQQGGSMGIALQASDNVGMQTVARVVQSTSSLLVSILYSLATSFTCICAWISHAKFTTSVLPSASAFAALPSYRLFPPHLVSQATLNAVPPLLL